MAPLPGEVKTKQLKYEIKLGLKSGTPRVELRSQKSARLASQRRKVLGKPDSSSSDVDSRRSG